MPMGSGCARYPPPRPSALPRLAHRSTLSSPPPSTITGTRRGPTFCSITRSDCQLVNVTLCARTTGREGPWSCAHVCGVSLRAARILPLFVSCLSSTSPTYPTLPYIHCTSCLFQSMQRLPLKPRFEPLAVRWTSKLPIEFVRVEAPGFAERPCAEPAHRCMRHTCAYGSRAHFRGDAGDRRR